MLAVSSFGERMSQRSLTDSNYLWTLISNLWTLISNGAVFPDQTPQITAPESLLAAVA